MTTNEIRLCDLTEYGLELDFCDGRRGSILLWRAMTPGVYRVEDRLLFFTDFDPTFAFEIPIYAYVSSVVYVDVLDLLG